MYLYVNMYIDNNLTYMNYLNYLSSLPKAIHKLYIYTCLHFITCGRCL